MAEYERVHPESRGEWRVWLEAHHDTSPGVWLVQWRPVTRLPRLTYDEAVEEALCFGWIDSRAKRLDADRSMITMTPRKPTSVWSRPNKERVERLIADGLMTPPGLRAVEIAKFNRSWQLLDDIDALVVPDDLAAALAASGAATQGFAALPPSTQKTLLYAIKSARRPETRTRRIAAAVEAAASAAPRARRPTA